MFEVVLLFLIGRLDASDFRQREHAHTALLVLVKAPEVEEHLRGMKPLTEEWRRRRGRIVGQGSSLTAQAERFFAQALRERFNDFWFCLRFGPSDELHVYSGENVWCGWGYGRKGMNILWVRTHLNDAWSRGKLLGFVRSRLELGRPYDIPDSIEFRLSWEAYYGPP